MGFNRSTILLSDDMETDNTYTVGKSKRKPKKKKRGRGNENQSMMRRTQRSSRPEIEPTPTTRYATRNVFKTGSLD